MILKCLPAGMFGSNCYITGNNGEGVIIDAGVDGAEVRKALQELDLKAKYIILTHSHIDHICAVDRIREYTGAKVLVHENDAQALENPVYNGSALFGGAEVFGNADMLLKDGDILEAGGMKFEIIHTPGHTPGGICIKTGDNIFTGDTLFRASIGRTDLENGNYSDIINSIKSRLMILPDEITVYPGHGLKTSIGYEKKHNPFIRL